MRTSVSPPSCSESVAEIKKGHLRGGPGSAVDTREVLFCQRNGCFPTTPWPRSTAPQSTFIAAADTWGWVNVQNPRAPATMGNRATGSAVACCEYTTCSDGCPEGQICDLVGPILPVVGFSSSRHEVSRGSPDTRPSSPARIGEAVARPVEYALRVKRLSVSVTQ